MRHHSTHPSKNENNMEKIAVIGLTGSGKTTLANKLGILLKLPVHHLDKFAWRNGVYASQQELIENVSTLVKNDKWILDGGQPRSKTLEIRIEHADTIIFFDLPFLLVMWRQIKRFFKYYKKTRPDMGGNRIQKYPLTWKEISYAWNYPTKDIYSKLDPYKNTRRIFIIKSPTDEKMLLKKIKPS